MGKSYKDMRKWRKENPSWHKRYGEKRNRDLKKIMEDDNVIYK